MQQPAEPAPGPGTHSGRRLPGASNVDGILLLLLPQ